MRRWAPPPDTADGTCAPLSSRRQGPLQQNADPGSQFDCRAPWTLAAAFAAARMQQPSTSILQPEHGAFGAASGSHRHRARTIIDGKPLRHRQGTRRCERRCTRIRCVACSRINDAQASRAVRAPHVDPRRIDERAPQPRTSRTRYANTRRTSRTRTRIASSLQRDFIHSLATPTPQKRIPARFRVRGSSDTATAAGPRAGACRAALMQPRPSASSAHVPSRARWPASPGTNALRP